MAGGNLRDALVGDIAANGAGANRCLGWYARGRCILVSVARGLVFLHSKGVRISASLGCAGLGTMLLLGNIMQHCLDVVPQRPSAAS